MRELEVNPPSSLLGVVNAILRGRGRRYELGRFAGPLSVKSVVSGTAVWETSSARFEVEPGSAVILNDREEYWVTIESLQPVETFCVFFARGFVEDDYRSLTSSSGELLESTTRFLAEARRRRIRGGSFAVSPRVFAAPRDGPPGRGIATDCGFESLGSFSTLFTRHVGQPPARFRKNREDSDSRKPYLSSHE